jgi:molybdopterin-guanine dinucleotide biosynthesis protein A
MGGDKALVPLDGIPLLRYPLEVLRQVLGTVVVAAKADTRLPRLDGSTRLVLEPEQPRHPLAGVRAASRRSRSMSARAARSRAR